MAGVAQTAVVTGAGRGLGVALSAALRAEGFAVIEATRAAGLDLARPETFAAFAESLGGCPVDLLVHNAAIRGDTGGLATLDVAEFEAVMRVNVLGPLLLTRALLANLRAGAGRVVMISSRAGSLAEGRSDEGDYAYKCSKAALNMAGLKLADETGLSVVALHPGWVQSDMGGPEADVPPAESAAGLVRQMQLAKSGSFWAWDGVEIGW
jgi:NAD(P)-dependent dehydrogenase (short-subunit alcohol dehydrogenase family)